MSKLTLKTQLVDHCKGIKRRPWTEDEDEAITLLVNAIGVRQWTIIASRLRTDFGISGRTGKQCRERWHNHLDPCVSKESWSEQEEKTMFQAHNSWGNKWALIAKYLPGRTDNAIKNHYYSCLRKQYRKLKGADASRQQLRKYDSLLTAYILKGISEESVENKENECLDLLNLEDIQLFEDLHGTDNSVQNDCWALADEFMVLPIGLF